ncbi:putative U box domain, armadillo-like helical, Zinc finger, RING/FYVE/PHD-type [Helianthus annuus]|nr:putative U box domain, armadillo-like helical, Zinc finger, RING/FYVE/PHD-type [Helianthus annuus]KAJ0520104.1 putative U box domain, armadillo-like helical, Zinc finger, RING/FYVE/PHD-type [Helianthus annuus]
MQAGMDMEKLLKCLTNSLSRFIHLVTFGAPTSLPSQQDYKHVANSLKLFKRVLDNIDESCIHSDEVLCKEFEELDVVVNEAREFIENWNVHMSKIYGVVQSRHLISKIQTCSVKICETVYGSLESSSSTTSTSTLVDTQRFVEELKNLKSETVSEKLEGALKFVREQKVPPLELIMEIIELLRLSSTHELLKEIVAVEKENIKVNQPNDINYISDLVFHIRETMVNLESFKTINGVSVPPYFICPLTLQLMFDPVIVSTGQTYERDSIQKWLNNGLLRCPVTRQTLSHRNLIPNYTVKALISNWCDENNIKVNRTVDHPDNCDKSSSEDQVVSNLTIENGFDRLSFQKSNHRSTEESCSHSRSESTSTAVSSSEHLCEMSGETASDTGVSPHSYPITVSPLPDSSRNDTTTFSYVKQLVSDLKSPSNETQTKAAEEIRYLAKNNMENRILIGQSGAIQPLVSLLHSNQKLTQEHAVTALLNLSINGNIKSMIAESGAVEPLIHVLETGNTCAKENAAAALFSLSLLEEYRVKIGQSGAVKPLVDLLGSGTLRGKKDAATALFNLSIFHENKARIIQAGAVRYLVELMDPETQMVDKAVALLSNLASVPEGCLVIAREGGIPLLVEVVETGSQRGKENAASILLQLCLNSPKYCRLVLQEGAVPPLVALSQSGTSRAKEKAQQLLSHFRSQRENASGRGKS